MGGGFAYAYLFRQYLISDSEKYRPLDCVSTHMQQLSVWLVLVTQDNYVPYLVVLSLYAGNLKILLPVQCLKILVFHTGNLSIIHFKRCCVSSISKHLAYAIRMPEIGILSFQVNVQTSCLSENLGDQCRKKNLGFCSSSVKKTRILPFQFNVLN